MRRIVPFLAGAGLTAHAIDGHVHIETGTVDEATSFVWAWAHFAVRQALTAGAVGEAEAAGWIAQLRQQNERGEMFGSSTFISVVARRP